MLKDTVSCTSKITFDTLDKGTAISLHISRYKNPQGGFQGQTLNMKVIPINTAIAFFINNLFN